jgi:hypothetical protein
MERKTKKICGHGEVIIVWEGASFLSPGMIDPDQV